MTQTLTIEGMSCGHCAAKVKAALETLAGVESAQVSHEDRSATVTLSAPVADDAYASAVADAGYTFVSATSDQDRGS